MNKDKADARKQFISNLYLFLPITIVVLFLLAYWSFRLVHKGLSYLLFNEIIKLNHCDLFVTLLMLLVVALAVVEKLIYKKQALEKANTEHQGNEK